MLKKILLLSGPNLNLLGSRDKEFYGSLKLKDIVKLLRKKAKQHNFKIKHIQSNYEGKLIDSIQKYSKKYTYIIINPGALSHYSYAIYDAIIDSNLPTVEVHLSKIETREIWRQHTVTSKACIACFSGKKEASYIEALDFLIHKFN